jgi:hypothetical protein
MINPLASFSSVQDFLGFVEICVAGSAICDGFYVLHNFVLDLHVALIAFDFTLVDMLGMHQICVVEFFKPVLLPVAFVTVFPGDFTVPENGVAVTFVARKTVIEHHCMVIPWRLSSDQGFFCMTMIAVIDLRVMFAFLEMADEAGTLGDGDVFSLNDLGMTACALKLFSSF